MDQRRVVGNKGREREQEKWGTWKLMWDMYAVANFSIIILTINYLEVGLWLHFKFLITVKHIVITENTNSPCHKVKTNTIPLTLKITNLCKYIIKTKEYK